MKRIKSILLMFILVLPVIAKADSAAPMSNYKVRISNPNGADLYVYNFDEKVYIKSDSKIEYDKIVKIMLEMKVDNQIYGGEVCTDGEKRICGYINLSNTSAVEVNLDDYYHESPLEYYVFEDTCYLYTGPSARAYSKISPATTLDVGYTFSSNYYDDMWVYVPEKKAWIYKYTYSGFTDLGSAGLLYIGTDYSRDILTLEEVKIYDNPKTKKTILATIPGNTKITINHSYSMEPHYPFYYVTYNGVTGFIETIHENKDNVITNIAYELSDLSLKVSNNEGVKLYSEANFNSSIIDTIPKGTQLNPDYAIFGSHTAWMYKVEYNNQVGWISGDTNYYNSDEEENIPEEISDDIVEDTDSDVIFIQDSEEENNKISINGALIFSIIIVIFVSLTAFVSVLLINKKKEQKNANTNTENIN